jgi:hypothetical protein
LYVSHIAFCDPRPSIESTVTQSNGYLAFEDAKQYVRALRFTNAAKFRAWSIGELKDLPSKPLFIPSNPHQVYRDEFQGYADFLGTGNLAPYRRQFAAFENARAFVRSLGLSSGHQFKLYCQGYFPGMPPKPDWLPTNPNITYRDKGWSGLMDWLGTGDPVLQRNSAMRPFEAAREFTHSLRLKTWLEWRTYVRGERPDLPQKPVDVPTNPQIAYFRRGWITWADFLGGEQRAWHSTEWRQFNEARDFVRTLGLKNQAEWREWYARSGPKDIPFNPDKAYSSWISYSDWFRQPTDYGAGASVSGQTASDWIRQRLAAEEREDIKAEKLLDVIAYKVSKSGPLEPRFAPSLSAARVAMQARQKTP